MRPLGQVPVLSESACVALERRALQRGIRHCGCRSATTLTLSVSAVDHCRSDVHSFERGPGASWLQNPELAPVEHYVAYVARTCVESRVMVWLGQKLTGPYRVDQPDVRVSPVKNLKNYSGYFIHLKLQLPAMKALRQNSVTEAELAAALEWINKKRARAA
jgi:hypothetical protein